MPNTSVGEKANIPNIHLSKHKHDSVIQSDISIIDKQTKRTVQFSMRLENLQDIQVSMKSFLSYEIRSVPVQIRNTEVLYYIHRKNNRSWILELYCTLYTQNEITRRRIKMRRKRIEKEKRNERIQNNENNKRWKCLYSLCSVLGTTRVQCNNTDKDSLYLNENEKKRKNTKTEQDSRNVMVPICVVCMHLGIPKQSYVVVAYLFIRSCPFTEYMKVWVRFSSEFFHLFQS